MLRIVCNTKILGIYKVLFFVKESLGKLSNGKTRFGYSNVKSGKF